MQRTILILATLALVGFAAQAAVAGGPEWSHGHGNYGPPHYTHGGYHGSYGHDRMYVARPAYVLPPAPVAAYYGGYGPGYGAYGTGYGAYGAGYGGYYVGYGAGYGYPAYYPPVSAGVRCWGRNVGIAVGF